MSKRPRPSITGFRPGPPWFFRCKKCGQTHARRINLSLRCPHCGASDVVRDPFPLK